MCHWNSIPHKLRNNRIYVIFLLSICFSYSCIQAFVPPFVFAGSSCSSSYVSENDWKVRHQVSRRDNATGKSKSRANGNKNGGGMKSKSKKLGGKNDTSPRASSAHKQKVEKRTSDKVTLPSNRNNAPPWQVGVSKEKTMSNNGSGKKSKKGIKMSLLSDADRSLLTWKPFVPERDLGGVAFVGSYLDSRLPPRIGVPEVAFLGRSNVGKSSLLNCLTAMAGKGTKDSDSANDQARVGKTPGATASVNLYALLEKRRNTSLERNRGNSGNNVVPPKPILGFTDLPGFGYAKLSKENKQSVEETAERYLGQRKELALGVLLVDARRMPSDDDRAVLAALYDLNVPLCIVATKVDKLSKVEVESSLEAIGKGLGLPPGQPLSISSMTGEGINVIWKIIMESCEAHIQELNENMEEFGSFSRPDDFNTIKLDEKGEFIDDDDVQYDMGFDWIHSDGRSVMYEDPNSDMNISEFHDDYDDEMDSEDEDSMIDQPNNSMDMKTLNERVRKMQRRGLL